MHPGSSRALRACSKPATGSERQPAFDFDKPFVVGVAGRASGSRRRRQADQAERAAAAGLLGYGASRDSQGPRSAARSASAPGLGGASAGGASTALGKTTDPKLPDLLVHDWKQHSPQVRNVILDTLLSRTAWTSSLLSSLEDGCVPPGEIDPARRQQLSRAAQRRASGSRRGRLRPPGPAPSGGRRFVPSGPRGSRVTGPPAPLCSRSCVPHAIAWGMKGSRSGPTSRRLPTSRPSRS